MPEANRSIHEATLHYSEPLLRRVVLAFWRRTVGIAFPLILLAMTGLIAVAVIFYGLNWYLAVTAAVPIVGTLIILATFVAHYRNTLMRFRKLKQPLATLRVSRKEFTIASDLGSSSMAWDSVQELWCFPDFWLLLVSRAQFVTLPLQGIPSATQRFIREQVERAGGKVR